MNKYLVIFNGRLVAFAISYSAARNEFRCHVRQKYSRKRRLKRSGSVSDILYRNPCLKDYPKYKIVSRQVFDKVFTGV